MQVCAYAGTGNVLKVQEMLHICTDHYDTDDTSATAKSKEKKDKTNKEKEKEDKDKKDDKEKDKDSKDKKEDEKEVDLSSQQSIAVLGE